jgi:hypothetical protein
MGAEPTDLITRGNEFVKIAKEFLKREKNWISAYNKKSTKIYQLIKNSQYKYIKIGTGINNRTGRPNFQVYIDRDTVRIAEDVYGLHKGLKTLKGEYVEAKNISECGTYHERRDDHAWTDLIDRLDGSSTHTYKLGTSYLCQLISEYNKSRVGWCISRDKVCIFLDNKYVEA